MLDCENYLPEWLRRSVWNNPVASDWDLWCVFLLGDVTLCIEINGGGAGVCNPATRCFLFSFPFGLMFHIKQLNITKISVRIHIVYKAPCHVRFHFASYLSSSERIRFFSLVPWDFFLDGKWASALYASNSQAHFNEKSADCLHLTK